VTTLPKGKVISLRPRPEVTERGLRALVAEARYALAAVDRGDVDEIHAAYLACMRAVRLVMDAGLSQPCRWRPVSCCPTCGAEVSGGRCWGCGSPPSGRAS